IRLNGTTISFAKEHMQVTLDGIAKGYIVDRASDILKTKGVENHLVNAGGDIRTSGTAARGKRWTVAIQDPGKTGGYPDVITMSDGAIATSGNYEVFYDQEKVFHHIVNPFTGRSPQLSASVSVTARTVMEADALSTAVFVLEPDSGIAFINRRTNCEGFVISRDGQSFHSSGWGP
ncbi:MAG: FAD:protein FMN transferase, partial [Desulfocapsaceae bacterium]|nr:FAD:protein FMN transferase [Desulfocapsaceae bacterium]